jgi:transglutaminase-like putative cysteine protease
MAMQEAAIERLARIISDKPDSGGSRPRKPFYGVHISLAEGWFTLFLLATVVYSTIWCVQAVGWVQHLNILSLTTALGLIGGLIAAKQRRLPRLALHAIAVTVGLLIAFWQTAGADYAGNTAAFVSGLQLWFHIAVSGGASNDDSIFLLFITALGFLLAYASAWLLYRTRSPWLMIVANGIVLLINLNNVQAGYVVFLIVFLVASLLLLLRFNLFESVQSWRRRGLRYGDDLGWDFMQAGALISIGVLIFAWLLPWGYINAAAAQLWNTKSNPYVQLQGLWNRLVSVSGGFTPANHGNFADTLALGGNPNLNNDLVFTVKSDDAAHPQYLASRSFDTYNGRIWMDGPTYSLSLKANQAFPSESALWHPVHQTITVVNPPGEQNPYLFGASQIGLVNQPATVVISANSGSVVTWLSRNGNLAAGERYTVTSYISSADIQSLRKVPLPADSPSLPPNYDGPPPLNYYDPGILNTYLQHPGNLDPHILQLAQSIVAGAHATTMYAKAMALEEYLQSHYKYNINVNLPSGEEGVSWFLFRSGNQGFCNYFASAMTIMARLLGMPARVVDGYTNGQPDPKHNQRLIHGVDAHLWTQIYFAGYGWINFEPSNGFSPFERPQPGTAGVNNPSTGSGPGDITGNNNHGKTRGPDSSDSSTGDVTTNSTRGQVPWTRGIGLSLGGIILLALFGLLFFSLWWRRLFRDRRISAQIYGRICLLANWAGVGIQDSQTPYESIHALSNLAPAQAPTLERFGDIYVRDLWAAPESTDHPRHTGETGELPGLWNRLQPAFFMYVLRHPHFLRSLSEGLLSSLSSILRRERSLRSGEVKVEEDLKLEDDTEA